ncbi:condensation domain-containing protein [Dactylosporangium fulvum]|uniref:Condensation domain-containing protein n=1 Tax=Dactylosporangium fulvum TaxID=53359 RepID=A0ABY5VXN5_9ACTN|nr:condensation domain-containing protein [Dactylosporangium fulvum]UWP82458.1 condensation domain-containing protein [Dactylosporangium fulvum]
MSDVMVTGGTVTRIRVPFTGEGSGEDELSWGQREIWQALLEQQTWMPIGGTRPLPAGSTVEDGVERLRYLMSRYQSMRTRLLFPADGPPRQVVHDAGEIDLEVVDAGPADPYEVAVAVQRRYEQTDYDFAGEWPVRMAVVRRDGTPTHLVVIMTHFVMDGRGAAVMLAESERNEAAPVRGMQALEQVRWQRSSAGRRQSDAAIRYWQATLQTIPASRFAGAGDPQAPRYWRGELSSAALPLAVQSIAAHTRVDASAVMLTVYALAASRVCGVNPVATRLVSSNRFRPGLAEVVGPVSQTALCAMDVAGCSFDEALERVQRASMLAYKHGYYDRARLEEVVAATARERGEAVDLNWFYNDRRGAAEPRLVDPALVRAALPRTVFTWTIKRDEVYPRLFLNVDDESPQTVRLHIEVDTHHVPPPVAEALVRAMEEVAVQTATGEATPS